MSRERSALVKNLAAVADFEIGPAAAVDPDEIPRVAPGLPVNTIRIAALPDQAHAPAGVHGAIIPPRIVRRAAHPRPPRPVRRRPIIPADRKVRAASAIHPDPATVPAPARTKNAW